MALLVIGGGVALVPVRLAKGKRLAELVALHDEVRRFELLRAILVLFCNRSLFSHIRARAR